MADERATYPVTMAVPTRWADNDQYGHVNNVAYYAWFDTVVNGWLMRATGVDTSALPAIGLVVETGCRYLRPLSFPETADVGLRVERLGRSSITYDLAVFTQGRDDPAAVARFVHVYVDRATRASVDVPAVIRSVLTPVMRPAPA